MGEHHDDWHRTACILCSIDCGIEVRADGPSISGRTWMRSSRSAPSGPTCPG